MLIIKGTGTKAGEVPLGQPEALRYFQGDVPEFIKKINEVDTVKPLSRENCYLVTHTPIGAMNYYVTVVYALEAEHTETGMLLKPLDFDTEKIQSPHQVLKGFVEGYLKTHPLADDRTGVDFQFSLAVEFPMPAALSLVPKGLVQTTANGIMTAKVGTTVESMYRKVLQDFNLPS